MISNFENAGLVMDQGAQQIGRAPSGRRASSKVPFSLEEALYLWKVP